MSGLVEKIPFFRLLLPAVTSLTVSAFLVELPFPLLGCIVGAGVVAISLLLPEKRQFACRWLFGGGLFVLIFFLFAMLFRQKEMESAYAFFRHSVGLHRHGDRFSGREVTHLRLQCPYRLSVTTPDCGLSAEG